ncbi:hypothetical protein BKA65DRAFT_531385 [Rhexocercosporidium sp. MPI-PUGE-AT-0058]|nr:hypothetical protein BKA65DRAFT_531385 [Rhexocercosporidium sp. MPI-PUGE-AT-0058]
MFTRFSNVWLRRLEKKAAQLLRSYQNKGQECSRRLPDAARLSTNGRTRVNFNSCNAKAHLAFLAGAGSALEIPKASFKDFIHHYSQWKHGKVLLGTAGSWFFLDVAFHGLGLNNSIILAAIGWTGGSTQYEIFRKNAIGNLILVCAGAIPGYWVSVATIDTLGRKTIQIGGFAILTILFIIIGFAYHHLSGHALLALYVLAQFFFNFGPHSTTYIVPGCIWSPANERSSAGRKGPLFFALVEPHHADLALFMLCGLFTSFLIPETKRKTLEELAGEVPGTPNYDPALTGGAYRQNSEEGSQPEKYRGNDSV